MQLKFLLVEDDPDAAMLICETLEDHFGKQCVKHVDTIARAIAAEVADVDMVISDMNLPDGMGLEVIDKLLARRPDLPIIMVTGEAVLELALDAIRKGAYDYVVKAGDYLFAVPVVVEKNMAIWRTKQENIELNEKMTRMLEEVRVKNQQLEEAVDKLETMAATDPLTGLHNRRAFHKVMEQRFAETQRHRYDLACLMIDLDGFKQLNDTLGHQAGDGLLQRASRVLEANCRRSDVAGRYGGDEFIVIFPQTDEATARQIAQRIADEFNRLGTASYEREDGSTGRVTMSMGLATYQHTRPANPDQMVAFADHALYRAKAEGKTCLRMYQPASQHAAKSSGQSVAKSA